MAPAANSRKVCVMDASGSLGSSLVQRLLQRGYIVHAAAPTFGDKQFCEGLNCDKRKLRVFKADPLDYHSIVEVLQGCCGLFYSWDQPIYDPLWLWMQESMAEVEVRAAHNVIEACAQTDTMEKVVFTSSVTAAVWRGDRATMTADIDEKHWSDINFCKKFKLWHAMAKTLAEKTGWALAMDRGLSMVSINGGLLMSPDLSIKSPYLKGAAEMFEDGVLVTVDIKFMVDAQICVFEDVSSYGRYFCFNRVIKTNEDAVRLANMLVPPSANPTSPMSLEDRQVYQQRISNNKLNKHMVNFDSSHEIAD
ncbi:3-beta hydroxysteroid dehydrogenase/isomerase [Dillenia turbinata]|uniref:3-beta hydroxysteroid dehydrogenase/isomerase n=1 Tax=Dillenia turbinata TaxID=194707 RepID=A0AAN8VZU5_9MAGN